MKIYDDEVCGDAGPFGGRCFTVLSDKKRNIPPEIWNGAIGADSRVGRLSLTAAGFGHMKASLLKLCQVSGDCTTAQIEVLKKLELNLQNFNRVAQNARVQAIKEAAANQAVAK